MEEAIGAAKAAKVAEATEAAEVADVSGDKVANVGRESYKCVVG